MANTDTYTAKMSPLDLQPGDKIVFEAINTTTGAAVAGVTVTAVAITGADLSELPAELETLGPFLLVPGPEA